MRCTAQNTTVCPVSCLPLSSPVACWQGDTSSQSEPGRYLQAVQALVQRYSRLTTADVAAAGTAGTAAAASSGDGCEALKVLAPLVINTPGWITGLGLDLLGEVLRCAAPTHGEGCGWVTGGGVSEERRTEHARPLLREGGGLDSIAEVLLCAASAAGKGMHYA